MATVLSTLYPPLIDTFMPAFPNVESAEVHFTISPYNSSYDIRYLHVTLVNQKTNKNAFNTEANINTPAGTALINGIWIIPFSESLNGDINPYLSLDREANYYTLYIPPTLLKSNGQTNEVPTFLTNGYYKLQLRFDKYISASNNWSITEATSSYISEKRAFFSEWSSVCLLKAIPEISVHFNNFTQELDNYLQQNSLSITNLPSNFTVPERVPQYMPGIIPFAGNLTFAGDASSGIASSTGSEYYNKDIRTTSNDEYLMSYQIVVKDNLDNVVKDSKIQYPSRNEKTNNFYWLCDMTSATTDIEYKVTLTFTTNNQYTFSKDFSFFLIPPSNLSFNPTISFNKIPLFEYGTKKETLVTCEDGWVEITVKSNDVIGSGYLFIKRATSLTDFVEWDLIDCYYVSDGDNFQRTIIDKTISSLVSYKYSCQFLTSKGSWTRTVISPEIVYPDFHDILLSRGDKQLAIRYNGQIASMTPVVNRVKIDTLGGRYPKFAENAKLHYKQFQLSGLITAESDFNRTFLNDLDYDDEMEAYNDHMNGKYMVRNDTVLEPDILYGIDENGETYSKTNGTYSYNVEVADGTVEGSIDRHIRDTQKNTKHDLYPKDNWWWERKFREEVVEWLNDGEPKLYRSMTEGNLIVMLDSISLTPNAQLGRRVWNFSCTVYEVGDGNSLEQLDSLGIFPIVNNYSANLVSSSSSSSEQGISTSEINRSSLGQISGVTANVDGPTKLINLGEQDSRYFDTVINSEGQTLSVKALSIGEQISNLYDGLYENYSFDPSSIRLKDLKIQFESLPQWYDLDSMSPEGTLEGGLYLTLEDNDGTNIPYIVKLDQNNNWKVFSIDNTPLWFKENMSISQFITEWENANGKIYHSVSDQSQQTYYIPQADYIEKYYKVQSDYVDDLEGKEYISKADVIKNIQFSTDPNNYSSYEPIGKIEKDKLNNIYYLLKEEEITWVEQPIYEYKSFISFERDEATNKFKTFYSDDSGYFYIEKDEQEENENSYKEYYAYEEEDNKSFIAKKNLPSTSYKKMYFGIPKLNGEGSQETDEEGKLIFEPEIERYLPKSEINSLLHKKIINPNISKWTTSKGLLEDKIKELEDELYIYKETKEEEPISVLPEDEIERQNLISLINGYIEKRDQREELVKIWDKWENLRMEYKSAYTENGTTLPTINGSDEYDDFIYSNYYKLLEEGKLDSTSSLEELTNITNELRKELMKRFEEKEIDTNASDYKPSSAAEEKFIKALKELGKEDDKEVQKWEEAHPADDKPSTEEQKKFENDFEEIKRQLGYIEYPEEEPDSNHFDLDTNDKYTHFLDLINYKKKYEETLKSLDDASKNKDIYYSLTDIENMKNKTFNNDKWCYGILSSSEEAEEEQIKIIESANELAQISDNVLYIHDNVYNFDKKLSDIISFFDSSPILYYFINETPYTKITEEENIYYNINDQYVILEYDNENKEKIYYAKYYLNNNKDYINKNEWAEPEEKYYCYHENEEIKGLLTTCVSLNKNNELIHYIKNNDEYQENTNDNDDDEHKDCYIKYDTGDTDIQKDTKPPSYALLKDVINLDEGEYIQIKEVSKFIKDPGDNLEDYVALGPGNNLIKVNTDTGENRTISGTGKVDDIIEALVWQLDEHKKIIARNNYGLGYKLKLNLISPYDSSVQLERTIFVNQRGYYQVPSNMVVKDITLFDGAKASLNYIIEYDLTYDDVTEPNTYEVAENIVGQISGDWAVNTNITPLVQAKYWAYDKQDSVITQQTLDYWKAISFDGTPYTVLYIQPTNQLNSIQYIVGRSGVLNLQTDYPTANLSIQGKRMVKAPISRQDYLDEWEYVLDESVYGGKQDEDTGFGTYWWILYNNQSSSESDIVVKVQYFNDSFEEINWDDLRDVADTWYQLGDEYHSSTEILTPKPNTIYGIINTLGMIEYKIYYLDQGWFTVEFPNAAEGDYSIAYARVPVYGMINYQAAITKKVWS